MPEGSAGQVPRPPIGARAGRKRVRQCPVRGAALGRRRAVEDRRPHERMSERDAPVGDHEQAGVLGGLERRRVDPRRSECRRDRLDLRLVRERRGHEQQRAL